MRKDKLKIAIYQQDIAWEDPSANYDKVREAFAATTELDVMVLPETFSTGFSDNMARMAEPMEGETFRFALEMARRHDALFVGTWTVMENGMVYNRMHWVKPDGNYGYYDKGHTFRMSSEASQLGRGTETKVFEWKGWHFKPAVCYDLRFPKWLRNERVGADGLAYDVLIFCANWPGSRHEAWSTLIKARGIENLAYVLGVNRVGTDGVGIPYTGNSAVIDYRGIPMAECESGQEQVVQVELDYEKLSAFRQHWPFYLDFD